MKVADLFAELGIKPDEKSIKAAQAKIDQFARKVEHRFAETEGKLRSSMNIAKFGPKLGTVGGALGGFAKRGMGAVGSLVGGVASAAGALGPAAVGAGFALAAKDAFAFDDAMTQLQISSRGAMGSMGQVRDLMFNVSRETGVAKEELAAGAQQFIALTGDGKAAAGSLETFAKTQRATGASMSDISSTAAALNQQLGIMPNEMEKAFSILVAGGKEGAVEFKDMAGLMSSLSANFRQFGGSQGAGGLAFLSASFQTARKSFGSASEAATGLEALMGAVVQHADKLKKGAGIEVFNVNAETGAKTLKSFEEILDSIANSKLATDPELLFETLGRKEAVKTVQELIRTKGAVRDLANSTMRANDVAEDYAKRQASASARLSKIWNDLKISAAEFFTPERMQSIVDVMKGIGAAAVETGKWIKYWIIDPLAAIPGEFKRLVDNVGNYANGSIVSKEILEKSPQYRALQDKKKWNAIGGSMEGRVDAFAAQFEKIRQAMPYEQGGRFNMEANSENPMSVGGVPSMAAPGFFQKGRGGLGAEFNITVQAPPGGDANQLANLITRQVRSLWERNRRSTSEATK